MAAIYSNGGNRWNILGFNFTKRDALSSVYKISMVLTETNQPQSSNISMYIIISIKALPSFQRLFARRKKREARRKSLWSHRLQIPLPHLIRFRI